jgi:hypothetical protein
MVKERFYNFAAAILVIAKIVFDKEARFVRHLTGTRACNHHGNLPNELHFEQRTGQTGDLVELADPMKSRETAGWIHSELRAPS